MLTNKCFCLIIMVLKYKGFIMAEQKTSRFGNWLGKKLYAMILACSTEDYACEDANGNVTVVPRNVWCAQALKENAGR